jgi:hypothetical protein
VDGITIHLRSSLAITQFIDECTSGENRARRATGPRLFRDAPLRLTERSYDDESANPAGSEGCRAHCLAPANEARMRQVCS